METFGEVVWPLGAKFSSGSLGLSVSLKRKQQSDAECASLSAEDERWPASQMDSPLSGSFHFLGLSFDLPDD